MLTVKESLPHELSPLGYHLSLLVKEKIWRGGFVDILSLLPSAEEFTLKSEKRDDKDDEKKRPVSFNNWLQGFCIFSGVL